MDSRIDDLAEGYRGEVWDEARERSIESLQKYHAVDHMGEQNEKHT